jgi:hypothetical protein
MEVVLRYSMCIANAQGKAVFLIVRSAMPESYFRTKVRVAGTRLWPSDQYLRLTSMTIMPSSS